MLYFVKNLKLKGFVDVKLIFSASLALLPAVRDV